MAPYISSTQESKRRTVPITYQDKGERPKKGKQIESSLVISFIKELSCCIHCKDQLSLFLTEHCCD